MLANKLLFKQLKCFIEQHLVVRLKSTCQNPQFTHLRFRVMQCSLLFPLKGYIGKKRSHHTLKHR